MAAFPTKKKMELFAHKKSARKNEVKKLTQRGSSGRQCIGKTKKITSPEK